MNDVLSVDEGHVAMDLRGREEAAPKKLNRARRAALLAKIGRLNIFVIISLLLYFLGASLALTLSARLANAQEVAPPELITLDKVGRASLLYRTSVAGSYLFAPEVETTVTIDITGVTARTVVRQTFVNPTESWLEGIYVVPLPDDSAIDRLRMRIGDRVIHAEIKEREEARRIYDEALEQGQRAALMEQGRPNQYTMSVANIGPKSSITVETEYQSLVKVDDGLFEIRFPMTVAPRYLPRNPGLVSVSTKNGVETGGPGGSVYAEGDEADGGTLPGGPVLIDDALVGVHLPVTIAVHLEAGFAPSGLVSPFHEIEIVEQDGNVFEIRLAADTVPADRDFVLEWQVPVSGGPSSHIFTQEDQENTGKKYILGLVVPPQTAPANDVPTPRDMIFILDKSGSMHGPSLAQAKSALLTALSRLGQADRFNLIAFSNESTAAFPAPVAATPNNLAIISGFIGSINADGGTEMGPALDLALAMQSANAQSHRLKQIVLLTDGAVGNEDQLFRTIAARLGNTRLFTIGIGSAPNSWFMRKAAEVGRGTFTHIGDVDQVEEKVAGLLEKLEEPVLTDIEVTVSGGAEFAMIPARIPDLYRGEPIVFTGVMEGAGGQTVTIKALLNGNPWRTTLDLSQANSDENSNVASMWARARIEQELDRLIDGSSDEVTVRDTVLALALKYHLISPYTSLVAVEEERARPEDVDLLSADVPRHLPDGWSAEHVFGIPDPKRAGSDRALAAPPPYQLAAMDVADVQGLGRVSRAVPQTATSADLMAMIGFVLLVLAGALIFWRRRSSGSINEGRAS